jgi:lipopolysaccharide biosynthesis glycosyltransferase
LKTSDVLPRDQRETIDIVTACDNSYAQHAHVFIASVLVGNPQSSFRVFVLVPQDFSHAPRLMQLEKHGNAKITFIEIKSALVEDLRVSQHITVAAYFRLLIGDVLPADIHRVLYFDSDIVVRGHLLPLWKTDLSNNIIGAVADAAVNKDTELKRGLGIAEEVPYFNSGVMLIDLDRWRSDEIASKALAFCREYPARLKYWDQCALNFVLTVACQDLSAIWNLQGAHVDTGDKQLLRDAKVVHFTASFKPWHFQCRHPLASLYWALLRDTPWHGYVPPDRTMLNILKRVATLIFPARLVQSARTALYRA